MSTPRLSLSAAIGRLRWPLPALLSWCAGWALWSLARSLGATELNAYAAGVLGALWLAWPCAGAWRVAIAGAGFPLSALALGAGTALPSWAWLLMLLPVLALYPLRAWRDAPFFPTPADALAGLDGIVPAPRRALDAGCGLGHGLQALHRLWPEAELDGLEWSAPLAAWARLRCRYAQVRRADMWTRSWAGHDLVYVFQRPESMARVHAKAEREMSGPAWLVSLEFAVPAVVPWARLQAPGRRTVWVYRVGAPAAHSIPAVAGR